jgi:hypothetical protein
LTANPSGANDPSLNLTYSDVFLNNPPPGFGTAPEMVLSPGTWKQLVD